MDFRVTYAGLKKKPNGLVSFKTTERSFNLTTGTLNRALAEFDTSDGISLEAFQSLVKQGLITLESVPGSVPESEVSGPSDIPVWHGEVLDLDSQLALFNKGGGEIVAPNPAPRPSALDTVGSKDYALNGRLQALLKLQAENQQLKGDINTLRENRGKALSAWEQVELVEAELLAENRLLRKQREAEDIDNKALDKQLEVLGIKGKSVRPSDD